MLKIIALGVAACLWMTAATVPPPTPAHKRPAAPAATIPDARIEANIRARFARSKSVSADKFTVRVQGGVATIEGRSDVVQHKGTATRMAKAAGAVAVVNKVQLSQAAKDKANNNLAKGRRRAQVKRGDARTAQ